MSKVFITAVGEYACTVGEPPRDLRADLAAVVRDPPRRVDRFIELALLGAGRCLREVKAPPSTAVYLASTRGDLHATLDVLKPLVREGQLPRPNTFINTVSNAACFHLAACFGLTSRSHCIGAQMFAFESALHLAIADVRAGAVPAALIGAVDAPTAPLDEHRRRFNLDPKTTVMESSRWLMLDMHDENALASIEAHQFPDREALRAWLERAPVAADVVRHSEAPCAGYDEPSSEALACEFVRVEGSTALLRVRTDRLGRSAAVLVRRQRVTPLATSPTPHSPDRRSR